MSDYIFDEDDFYSGLLSLVGAMFRLAAQDYKSKGSRKIEVDEFIESEWFYEICDMLDVSPNDVKKRICSGKVRQRNENKCPRKD